MKLKVFKYIILLSCIWVYIYADQDYFLYNYNDTIELQQIDIKDSKEKVFQFDYLKGVFNNQIYSEKKNQLIIINDQLIFFSSINLIIKNTL